MAEFLYHAILLGIGATLIFDLWGLFLNRAFGVPLSNWGMVGRWFCHLFQGRAFHDDISLADPFSHERVAGWVGHYLVGILFAVLLLAMTSAQWLANPTLLPPLAVGLATVGLGWFVLQPGMGAGIAASKRPNAGQIRFLNILGHLVFGLGLYGTALAIR
ncbi:DUF2938 domain-containing protein [Microvirga pudoricolor]|uniref:DUF2938 domain-containing protein n=1 Tax=Microvirga pudoricolor TaxID=2778729 RepID=UPI00194E1D40|nr:DUF2938 domain-containing protein [Microvirga pudoricolor]MBM6596774.1 DUF2938 domain-containing protein [Microvirga pudoricolor]